MINRTNVCTMVVIQLGGEFASVLHDTVLSVVPFDILVVLSEVVL